MNNKKGIPSPYQIDFGNYDDSFDSYDDLPATPAWMQTVGAALARKFGITVKTGTPKWEIDHALNEFRTGDIDVVYSRRGVLGLLLNGTGRLAKSIEFPRTIRAAQSFAKEHVVDLPVAKHFGALVKTIDEVRTDDEMAKEYAGGERVVETMHAQAYEAANKALTMMAMDMRARREMARLSLDWLKGFTVIVKAIAKESITETNPKPGLVRDVEVAMTEFHLEKTEAVFSVSFGDVIARIKKHPNVTTQGRVLAVLLMALYPAQTDEIIKVMVRAYPRNVTVFNGRLAYYPATRPDEETLIKLATVIQKKVNEVKFFASHTGGHAQYVIAKAEQYYHAHRLGIEYVSPYAGYDMEAKALEVEEANEAARKVAYAMVDRGITVDITDSVAFSKELLPLVSPFPFLDLNDQKSDADKKGNGSMQKRLSGAGNGSRAQKRDKQREKKSPADRAKDRKKMESLDNQKNQKKVDNERKGYSILGMGSLDPLERYLYIIGPYLSRIQTTASRIKRLLKVNDPAGLRGAYRKGKELNTRILYRHRIDDYRLFSRKEVEKDQSYGFVVTGDISGSTETNYASGTNRQIQDEILAASFLIAEIAERIGEKVMCAVSLFDDTAKETKRAGAYLSRGTVLKQIKSHGGGTNVHEAGTMVAEDLQDLADFKMKQKTIIFITDGGFNSHEFLSTVQAAKKHKASIAYFQICADVSYGVRMCRDVEEFVAKNAKGVRVRSRNLVPSHINRLPEEMVQLMKETIGVSDR